MLQVSCPICERVTEGPSVAEMPHYPFCSARCRLIDLGRWMGESYRIPPDADAEAPAEDEEETDIP